MQNVKDTQFIEKYRIAPPDFKTRCFLQAYQPLKNRQVLVLNAFDNHIPEILADEGCKVTAADHRSRYISEIPSEDYLLVEGPYSLLKKSSNTYHVITCFDVLQFYKYGYFSEGSNVDADKDLMQILQKLLKKDGLLFLSIPVGSGHRNTSNMRVYGRLAPNASLFCGLKVVSQRFVCSNYPQSGGRDDTLKFVSESEAFDPDNTLPYEMFIVLKKTERSDAK